jgi:hypothetical protein
LQDFFHDRIGGFGLRPPCSPHLTPPELFLWAFLKKSLRQ